LEDGVLAMAPASLSVTSFRAKKAYLAYLESERLQNYLQPVWVFVGKAHLANGSQLDWAAYVPAVDPDWIQ